MKSILHVSLVGLPPIFEIDNINPFYSGNGKEYYFSASEHYAFVLFGDESAVWS